MRKRSQACLLSPSKVLEWAGEALAIHIFDLPALARFSAPANLNVSVNGNKGPKACLALFQRNWSKAGRFHILILHCTHPLMPEARRRTALPHNDELAPARKLNPLSPPECRGAPQASYRSR